MAFKLFDSYGFPLDLTQLILAEQSQSVGRALTVDTNRFDELMENQRSLSKTGVVRSGKQGSFDLASHMLQSDIRCHFSGYDSLVEKCSKVLFVSSVSGATLPEYWVAIQPCPFYPEGGGQVGDRGFLIFAGEIDAKLEVLDTTRPFEGGIILRVRSECPLDVSRLLGSQVVAVVDKDKRKRITSHHSATHLLHSALQHILEPQATEAHIIHQAGSLVEPSRLRFDFNWHSQVTKTQLIQIEDWVNTTAKADVPVIVSEMPLSQAKSIGAKAAFDEKYGDTVRVVQIGSEKSHMSLELCGGTHVSSSLDVFPFKILSEASIASGTRRIEAVAGLSCVEYLLDRDALLVEASQRLQSTPSQLSETIHRLSASCKKAESDVSTLKNLILSSSSSAPTSTCSIKIKEHEHVLGIQVAPHIFFDSIDDLHKLAVNVATASHQLAFSMVVCLSDSKGADRSARCVIVSAAAPSSIPVLAAWQSIQSRWQRNTGLAAKGGGKHFVQVRIIVLLFNTDTVRCLQQFTVRLSEKSGCFEIFCLSLAISFNLM